MEEELPSKRRELGTGSREAAKEGEEVAEDTEGT
jgi:hypothetical protein